MLRFSPFILCAIFSLCVTSCRSKSFEQNVQEHVKEWVGRVIEIPKGLTTVIGDQEFDLNSVNPRFKLLVAIKPSGCTSCQMQLREWDYFVAEMQNLCEDPDDIELIYVVEDSLTTNVRNALASYDFRRPITLDPDRCLTAINKLPEANEFRTFLLNEENRVIAIGNPFLFPGIRALYLKAVGDVMESDNVQEKSAIAIERRMLPLGDLKESKSISSQIEVRNLTDSIVRIDTIYTSCECVSVTTRSHIIRPRGSIRLTARFTPENMADERGRIVRYIYIKANGEKTEHTVTLYGYYSTME